MDVGRLRTTKPKGEFVELDNEAGKGASCERLSHAAQDVDLEAFHIDFANPERGSGKTELGFAAPDVEWKNVDFAKRSSGQLRVRSKRGVSGIGHTRMQAEPGPLVAQTDIGRVQAPERIRFLNRLNLGECKRIGLEGVHFHPS